MTLARTGAIATTLALAACRHHAATIPSTSNGNDTQVAPAPRLAPTIAPIDLVLGRADAANAWHARIVDYDRAWLHDGDEPVVNSQPAPADDEVPLAGMTADAVRVMIESDDARFCVWMPRADLAQVIDTRTRVVIDGEPNGGDAGVTAHAGARVTRHDRDRVTLDDDGVEATGEVPLDALGDAWAPERDAPAIASGEGDMRVDKGVAIRASPTQDGTLLATTTDEDTVRVVAPHGDWTEIVVGGARLSVDGYVPADEVGPAGVIGGVGLGGGYGVSDTIAVDVPAGACLHDGVAGEVVGVTLERRTRSGLTTSDPAWFQVYVGASWGELLLSYRLGDACGLPAKTTTPR